MHYTIDKDPVINAKVEKDQEYINSQVLDLLGNHIHSILLCGGFGRGEGTVDVRGNEIHIVNDYDITILLKEKNPFKYVRLYKKFHAPLQNLAHKLADDLKMKQIDLGLKHFSYFEKQTALKIENYEVKHGHVMTYGEEDPTDDMPDWRAEYIPLFEGTWLFRNRGAGMLIPALYFMCDGGVPEDKKENFVIECNKAQLAMGDSILLLNRLYHHLYSERLRRIEDLDVSSIPEGTTIIEHYREALEQKLRPDSNKFYKRDLKKWWFEIKNLMDIFYRYFESQRLCINFSDWLEYAELSKPEDALEMRMFLSSLLRSPLSIFSSSKRRRTLLKSRKSCFIAIVALLLFSHQNDHFFSPYIEKAASKLCIPLNENKRQNWISLVRTFLHELHPGGEVGRAIKL